MLGSLYASRIELRTLRASVPSLGAAIRIARLRITSKFDKTHRFILGERRRGEKLCGFGLLEHNAQEPGDGRGTARILSLAPYLSQTSSFANHVIRCFLIEAFRQTTVRETPPSRVGLKRFQKSHQKPPTRTVQRHVQFRYE